MSEAVQWRADGSPFSERFNDIYRSHGLDGLGGLAQARHVFLQGCGLPQAWGLQRQWRILETGFGLGLNFLACWQAWKADPQRPRMLHFASIEAYPVSAEDLLRSAAPYPELLPLAQELAQQWYGLLPGFHRMVFEGGHVLLTLCVGDVKAQLRELAFEADSVFLDGFSPARNPEMWDGYTLKAVARLCRRRTRAATWSVVRELKGGLSQCGFEVKRVDGLPPKLHCLQAEFNPAWEPKRSRPATTHVPSAQPGRCVVIGAGLAGAAVAASLARRGWDVVVLDAAVEPASGASGLPAGVLAPHVSPDDSLLSRLTRAGIRMSLQQCRALLNAGEDWQASGVLEHRVDGTPGLAASWPATGLDWTQEADTAHKAKAGLGSGARALWHLQAGWVKPAKLVHAWLAHPAIEWRGAMMVTQVVPVEDGWSVRGPSGQALDRGDIVVIAAGHASLELAIGAASMPPLQAIRGQVTWGLRLSDSASLPDFPVNGHGSLIPAIPTLEGDIWLAGAGFERDNTDTRTQASDQALNLERLRVLLPGAAASLSGQFEPDKARAWAGVRCASPDRLPLAGALNPRTRPGLYLCTAMGSRGLTFAALCGELLAAQLHDEPSPLERRLSRSVSADRWNPS